VEKWDGGHHNKNEKRWSAPCSTAAKINQTAECQQQTKQGEDTITKKKTLTALISQIT